LRKNGVEVEECHDASPSHIARIYKLIKKHHGIDYDAMIVGFPGQKIFPLAKLLSQKRKTPMILDAFLSFYDSSVFDRKEVEEGSFKARLYYYLDKYSCKVSDRVLLDTEEHIKYFCEEFHLEREKFGRIFIGADDDVFYPREANRQDGFTVVFHGTFIPLQGIQYILKAAKLLKEEEIKFDIIGTGQTYESAVRLVRKLDLKNVRLRGRVKYEELPDLIARADVGLGIFGDTPKAKRVIPNKAYEILAMKKPLITGDSPAARETLTNKENALLCEMANPEAIVNSIVKLKEDEKLRKRISDKGYKLFKEKFSPKMIGREVKKVIYEVM
jgi:glycosyltransferase involved in cell wall biosynthesis